MPPFVLLTVVCAVLAAVFGALFLALPRGPRTVMAVAAVVTAAATLVGAVGGVLQMLSS